MSLMLSEIKKKLLLILKKILVNIQFLTILWYNSIVIYILFYLESISRERNRKRQKERKKTEKISDALLHRRACHKRGSDGKKKRRGRMQICVEIYIGIKSHACFSACENPKSVFARRVTCLMKYIIRLDIFRVAWKFAQCEMRLERTFINKI